MDPSGGGIGKAAAEMMKEMQRTQQQEMQQLQQQDTQKTGGANAFQQHLQAQQSQRVNQATQISQVNKSANILQQAKLNAKAPITRVGAAAKAKSSRVVTMLQGLIGGQDRMTRIMKVALSGRQMSPPELLAMQAGVYRFSQELELTSKVVEKATSGIKQTMNTQV